MHEISRRSGSSSHREGRNPSANFTCSLCGSDARAGFLILSLVRGTLCPDVPPSKTGKVQLARQLESPPLMIPTQLGHTLGNRGQRDLEKSHSTTQSS